MNDNIKHIQRRTWPYFLISAILHAAILVPLFFVPWFTKLTANDTPALFWFSPDKETVGYESAPERINPKEPVAIEPVMPTPTEIPFVVLSDSDFPEKIQEPKPNPLPEPAPVLASPPVSASAAVSETKPQIMGTNKLPVYPAMARQLGQEGQVILLLEIDESGSVLDIKITQSSGYKLLDEAAIKAVKLWKFAPATKNGVFVKSPIEIPIRFKLT